MHASDKEYCKRVAAEFAIDELVTSNSVLGLGSGDMMSHAIHHLGKRIADGRLQGVVAVPACSAAAHEAAFAGVPLTSLEQHPQIDLALMEADQLDVGANAFVTGSFSEPQQPQLPQTRRVLAAAGRTALLVDDAHVVARLTTSLPVFIDADGWEEPAEELDDIFLGDAELWRRPSSGTANPRGGDQPYVSDDGCNIVDIRFYERYKLLGEAAPYAAIAAEIEAVPGVVAHGLVVGAADLAVVALPGQPPSLTDVRAASPVAGGGGGSGADS